MILLLSPAKNLDTKSEYQVPHASEPTLLDHSDKLMATLKKKSAKQLAKLMKLSPALAELNFERNQLWTKEHNNKNARPAITSFNGAVYLGLDSKTFDSKDLEFAQKNIAILSGLYGVLKPLDLMQPYRLEMGSKLSMGRKKNLYQYWGSTITDQLNAMAKGHDVFVNLASNEYFKSVDQKLLAKPVVTCHFKELRNGEYKAIMTYAKTARGLMARFAVKNKVQTAEELKNFNLEGYEFNAELSNDKDWVFTR